MVRSGLYGSLRIFGVWNYASTPEWGALAKRALAGEKFPGLDKLR